MAPGAAKWAHLLVRGHWGPHIASRTDPMQPFVFASYATLARAIQLQPPSRVAATTLFNASIYALLAGAPGEVKAHLQEGGVSTVMSQDPLASPSFARRKNYGEVVAVRANPEKPALGLLYGNLSGPRENPNGRKVDC